jgi:ribonuclease E
MPNKMLIDASHPEETRVVVTRGNRIEEFDFESQDKKQLKGNIYLARVTRVEPSLQAAFVEYGGNRHGFLAFSEIHPDYYQIPVADRQALLRADAEAAEAEEEEDEAEERGRNRRRGRSGKSRRRSDEQESRAELSSDAPEETESAAGESGTENSSDHPSLEESQDPGAAMAAEAHADVVSERLPANGDDAADSGEDGFEEVNGAGSNGDEVELVGQEDALEEVPSRRRQPRRQYKIQEVIKRRQILLVQVVKEERGNKGAALTTYLSLAGRYSVLMPNTARGGGISRKITSAQDRKRLKEVVSDLDVPEGMGVILRTAGANRTKAEIKRDYEYLMRLWENVRNLTLQSTAPALVYEEGSLIKRSVRDLYNKDINEILVAGDEGYREAKDFMRMLMPSHAKMVQPYRDNVPIFARNGIEAQLDRMLQPQVTLKSGGYIIINQTEALVSIDVNSGRSTKEHSIEDTALQTNLEAAEEVARQLRLRDLAGLIVIDFIDMEENRNNRSVEKRLKDHLKHDRARIQVGRISHFGLLEMSRQRIRASVLESTMKPCPHCGGTGHVRSDSSVALHVVRAIEEFLLKDNRNHISVRTPVATALYVLNHKRHSLADLEARFGLTIMIEADDSVGPQHYLITRGLPVEHPVTIPAVSPIESMAPELEEEAEPELAGEEEEAEAQTDGARPEDPNGGEGEHGRRKRRRRRRRGGREREAGAEQERVHTAVATSEDADVAEDDEESESVADSADSGVRAELSGESERKKRRRGKRGGKRNRRDEMAAEAETGDGAEAMGAGGTGLPESPAEAETVSEALAAESAPSQQAPLEEASPRETPAEKPKRARRASKRVAAAEEPGKTVTQAADAEMLPEPPPAAAEETVPAPLEEQAAKPRPSRRRAVAAEAAPVPEPTVVSSSANTNEAEQPAKPRKAGWWQRKGFF